MKKAAPYEYCPEININLKQRTDYYINSNYDDIQNKLTRVASSIAEELGVFPFVMTMPVLKELAPLKYASMFLGIILNMIIFILLLLSVVLLYSLLLVSVETKTFEMGILRMLGFNKIGIILMIFIQSITFVLPGILLGLLLAIPCLYFAYIKIKDSSGAQISVLPSINSVIYATSIGLLIPIISAYYPIKEALRQTLNQSLDVTHSKTSSVKITVSTQN